MANEQLLSYIQTSMHAGYSQEEMSVALRAAGWKEEDIQAGFTEVSQPAPNVAIPQPAASTLPSKVAEKPATYTPPSEPVSFAQKSTNLEIARIQQELRGSSTGTIPTQSQSGESGIIGFLIKNNLASSKQGAQMALAAMVVLLCVIVYWLL